MDAAREGNISLMEEILNSSFFIDINARDDKVSMKWIDHMISWNHMIYSSVDRIYGYSLESSSNTYGSIEYET